MKQVCRCVFVGRAPGARFATLRSACSIHYKRQNKNSKAKVSLLRRVVGYLAGPRIVFAARRLILEQSHTDENFVLLFVSCCAVQVPCVSLFLARSLFLHPSVFQLYFPCRRNCLHSLLRRILLSLHRCSCNQPSAVSPVRALRQNSIRVRVRVG